MEIAERYKLIEKYKDGYRVVAEAQALFARFGWPALLLAWLPLLGDPLTFVAGTLNYPPGRFLILVFLGKAGRYGALWAGWLSLA